MDWLLSRVLAAVVATLACSVAFAALGTVVGWPVLGGMLGAAIGVALLVVRDAYKANRLIGWIRRAQDPEFAEAPRDSGLWGEFSYRIERAFRLRDQRINEETGRLEQFLAAIEASPNGVMMLDGNEQIVWCNRIAAEHFGLDPVSDRLQRVTNLVRTPTFVAHLQAGRYDEPVVTPGPLGRGTLSVLFRSYGDGMKLLLSQDITERERNDAMRRDFVANVSHEIRTPLTVLAGFVETLARLPLTEVERQRVLVLMEQQTHRMQALVADLLTLARLEGSPRPTVDRWHPVLALFKRAEGDALALSAGRHELRVDATAELAQAELAGSDTELLSAVGNLLNNAVRYTPAGGRIELSLALREDGSARIDVSDSGAGIAKEHLSRLTERFYRVDGSRSRDTGGTGLGLSIVKHVVQRHGGAIEIRSEPGKGSTFTLLLPAARVRLRSVDSDSNSASGQAALAGVA